MWHVSFRRRGAEHDPYEGFEAPTVVFPVDAPFDQLPARAREVLAQLVREPAEWHPTHLMWHGGVDETEAPF